jgi:hypothetical protein
MQFNLGFEGVEHEWLRYGIAFSLERTQTLRDPLTLKPKIQKMNEYLRENQSELEDLRFWYYRNEQRSDILPLQPVTEDLIHPKTFLFWGKMALSRTIQPEEVLFLFDRLLNVYKYVEGKIPLSKQPSNLGGRIPFQSWLQHRA